MKSICAQKNSIKYDSNDLASSDVFVKLSQHTSVEMSDFTVFVLVFLSYFLHLQSLKYHVSEMILGSQSIIQDTVAAQSRSNIATKLQQPGTFDISLAKIYTTLTNEEKLYKTKLFGILDRPVPLFKIAIPFLVGIVVFIVFLSLTAPVWPSQLGGDNLVIIGLLTMVASLALSYFVLTVETPAIVWIILVSVAFATYAVVKTSNCDANKVCLYKPEGYGNNFLDFNYLWIGLAVGMFFIQKVMFSILLYRHGPFRLLRGFSLMFFLLFYVFMIVTTFQSSPETKHHQHTPCTSKGTFVGQLIYWPLFLVIVFYIERGSYTFRDEINIPNFAMSILTYVLSTLFFLVPILTIRTWEGNRDTAISRMTCSLRQPTISLDTPSSRCCKTQKISSSSLRTFDVHFNNLLGKQDVVGENVSMTFELVKIVSGEEQSIPTDQITYENPPPPTRPYVLQIVRGSTTGVSISNGELLGQFQIAMKAGPNAFTQSDEGRADYILKITFEDQSQLSFYQRFSSITHNQSLTFLQTSDRLDRYSVPTLMPDGSAMPSGSFSVGSDGVVRNESGLPLMSNGEAMPTDHTIRRDNVVLDESSNPVKDKMGQNLQVVRGTQVVKLEDTSETEAEASETEAVVGCTGRNKPEGINLRGNLERNAFTPGSGVNPIVFTGRHSNTGPGMSTLWGLIVGTAIASLYLGFTNAAKQDPNDASAINRAMTRAARGGRSKSSVDGSEPQRFGVAGFLTGIAFGSIYGGLVGAPAGFFSGLIVEGIRAKNKARQIRFEYLDENNYPVARVAADDAAVAEGLQEKVPLNSTHIDPIWKECSKSDQDATSSVANTQTCENSETPPLTYTPPGHCKYIADIDINFSNYPDTEKDKHYELTFNANTGGSDKVHIHFKQKPDDDPIFGPESYMYWLLFIVFLILLTFVYQVALLAFGADKIFTKKLQQATKVVFKGTSVIAEGAERVGQLGKLSSSNATREPRLPDEATRGRKAKIVASKIGQGLATAGKKVVDATSAVGGGVKYVSGKATFGIGDAARKGGNLLYEPVRKAVQFKDSSLLREFEPRMPGTKKSRIKPLNFPFQNNPNPNPKPNSDQSVKSTV